MAAPSICDGEKYDVFPDVIGKGAFSVVHLGRTKEGRYVAIKVASKLNEIEAMKKEVEVLKLMRNVPNVVQYIGSELTSDTFSFAMEFAQKSLGSVMNQAEYLAGLPMDMLIDLTIDCAAALSALNSKNVAHRDIKHMNILMFPGSPTNGRRSSHVFKMCDLGCAKLEQLNEMDTLVGTPNMLHPRLAVELCRTHNWHTKASYSAEECDLWSLACTLYYCATGRFPFKHDNGETNLYFQAALELTRNEDAIGMAYTGKKFKNEHTNKMQYEFEPITELPSRDNKFPKWFVYVFTSLLRQFFHHPSFRMYSEIAASLKNATRKVFLSIDQLSIVDHLDMSQAPHIGHSFPPLAVCLGYSERTHLKLISLTSIQYCEPNMKRLGRLNDDCYLVYPMCDEVSLRKINPRKTCYDESINKHEELLINVRKAKIYTALTSLNESDKFWELFNKISKILSTQFSLLVDELSREERVRDSSRFAVYIETASIPMTLFDMGNPQDCEISAQCADRAKETRKELDRHMKVANELEEAARKRMEEAHLLPLNDMELPGIREELERYSMATKKEILATSIYSQKLTDRALQRRTSLLQQIFDVDSRTGKNKIKAALDLAGSLTILREKYRGLQEIISECIEVLETPFQAMKTIVNRYVAENNIDCKKIRETLRYESVEYQESRKKIKTSYKATAALAKELEVELANMGMEFERLGDTILREEAAGCSTEIVAEPESAEDVETLKNENFLKKAKDVETTSSASCSPRLNYSSSSEAGSTSFESTPSPTQHGKSFFATLMDVIARKPDFL